MGSVCGSDGTSRRSNKQPCHKTVRSPQHTCRRKMVPIRNDGIRVHRYPTVLLSQGEKTESDKDRDRITDTRMDRVEGPDSTTTSEISGTVYSPILHLSTRSSKPGRSCIVHGMSSLSIRRTVSISNKITIHEFIDWFPEERKGPWMRIAIDNERFRRHIKASELLLEIFSQIVIVKKCCVILIKIQKSENIVVL